MHIGDRGFLPVSHTKTVQRLSYRVTVPMSLGLESINLPFLAPWRSTEVQPRATTNPTGRFLFFKSQGKVLRERNCLKVTGRIQKGTHKGQLTVEAAPPLSGDAVMDEGRGRPRPRTSAFHTRKSRSKPCLLGPKGAHPPAKQLALRCRSPETHPCTWDLPRCEPGPAPGWGPGSGAQPWSYRTGPAASFCIRTSRKAHSCHPRAVTENPLTDLGLRSSVLHPD